MQIRVNARLLGRGGWGCFLILAFSAGFPGPAVAVDSASISTEAADFFEKEIRPILVERCQQCHGPKKQWAGLRLDSRQAILDGGDSGPAVIVGNAATSELIQRVTDKDDSVRMPPPDAGPALSERQTEMLTLWVQQGALWPDSPAATSGEVTEAQRTHWAFQPVKRHDPPAVRDEDWVKTPVDRFLLHRLELEGLQPSQPANRRTLIRRATYDLTGLPPTPEEIEAFIRDDAPDAYARLIDRLLASPHYGEQWGRHWLDVARYSDTKGYVYAREERRFVHAAVYRDWVVQALNEDLPYNRFLLLQLAGNQAAPDDPSAGAAMGLLTLGRRFLGVSHDIIDDRIDVVTRGTMGLTVACARCHDHKYDPIPTADYYSLYGVFQNCAEILRPLPRAADVPAPAAEYEAELQRRKLKLEQALTAQRTEAASRIRKRAADYLLAQRELEKYPEQSFSQLLTKDDLIPAIVWRWHAYLARSAKNGDRIFRPWLAYAALKDGEFAERTEAVANRLKLSEEEVHPRLLKALEVPPNSARELADRYAVAFAEVDQQWQAVCAAAERDKLPPPQRLENPDDEELRQALYGPGSPCTIPHEDIVNIELMFDIGTTTELWKLQGEVERWLLQTPDAAPHAVMLADRSHTVTSQVFRRGNPTNRGEEVPRQFLKVIAGADRQPFQNGSGLLELAQSIVDPANPLTARVWVNRVWMHHFGEGLVRTPSDFGLRAEPPSHPELLDWLAHEFMASGWSTKWLHRQMMLSATYQQQSDGRNDTGNLLRGHELDPENRLLWKMKPRRLSFEELRDTYLAVSGELHLGKPKGTSTDLFSAGPEGFQRTIYGHIDRQFVPAVMRIFDFANPDLHTPQRSETTVPQQALFVLNHPFVADRARKVAQVVAAEPSVPAEAQVRRLYQIVYQRDPTEAQLQAAVAFIETAHDATDESAVSAASQAWTYGYGELDEGQGRTKSFQPLPHFTGSAWQGGQQWPDQTLGWVQITAQGGHPGNDLRHAAIRRWTAARTLSIRIKSTIKHEVAAGDGIRCWISSSRQGLLGSAKVHNASQPLDVASVEVQQGDTIDFIVDYNADLNSEQHLWAPEIISLSVPANGTDEQVTQWSAQRDFTQPATAFLSPWQQLAQVLLASNELLFVD